TEAVPCICGCPWGPAPRAPAGVVPEANGLAGGFTRVRVTVTLGIGSPVVTRATTPEIKPFGAGTSGSGPPKVPWAQSVDDDKSKASARFLKVYLQDIYTIQAFYDFSE